MDDNFQHLYQPILALPLLEFALHPESHATTTVQQSVSIFVVIVLYNMEASRSSTYRTLLAALGRTPAPLRIEILLYNNTPAITHDDLPKHVHYFASPMNSGLSTAYNIATEWANRRGFTWLLTLDQDTQLPESFLDQISVIAQDQQENPLVAAIVPHLSSGGTSLSPIWFKYGISPRPLPKNYSGFSNEAVYAFNSGSLVRIETLAQIGGYSPLFWLDNSDTYLYRRLEQYGKKVFVAGAIQLQHDLSTMDIKSKMSLQRYRDSLESGSAIWDMEMDWVRGIEQTWRLLGLYLSQIYRKREPEIRQITLNVIGKRIFRSKKTRVRDWLEGQDVRIAASSKRAS
jgi:GT2 family glycosyltransferase